MTQTTHYQRRRLVAVNDSLVFFGLATVLLSYAGLTEISIAILCTTAVVLFVCIGFWASVLLC